MSRGSSTIDPDNRYPKRWVSILLTDFDPRFKVILSYVFIIYISHLLVSLGSRFWISFLVGLSFIMRNLFETLIDVGSGLLLSTLVQLYIFPYFDMYPTVWESFHIAVIFTAISICRSWFWRTFFRRKKSWKKFLILYI